MFTEQDVENDGKIKKEAGPEMVSTARQTSPRIFQHFERVCDSIGQEPSVVLGDLLIRALNNESNAKEILNVDVSLEALQTGDYRKDDIRFVKEVSEEFDLTPEEKKHPIDRLIDKRIEAVGGGPLDRTSRDASDEEVRKLEKKIDRLESKLDEDGSESVETEEVTVQKESSDDSSGEKKDIDDIFGDSDDEEDVELEQDEGVPLSVDEGVDEDE